MKLINEDLFHKLCIKMKLSLDDEEKIRTIIAHIENHEEFQKRSTMKFLHHGEKTLGEHILTTAISSYKIAKKKDLNLEIVLKIAMFHDLYTLPWQNSPIKDKMLSNRHGFRHPIEAIINSSIWFPDDYKDLEKAKIIIDGIAHHMFPLPVVKYKTLDNNPLELRNLDLLPQVKEEIIKILFDTTSKGKIGNLSLARANTKEGRVIVLADKIASLTDIEFTDIDSLIALLTGKNKRLKK